MYTINLTTGQVIRQDGKIVAPCQSNEDVDFLDYAAWVNAGNWPIKTKSITEKSRDELKLDRQTAVDAIVVTTSTGKTFDGDETSQTRMARAIIALQASGQPSVTWVLADNTATEATVAELSEALALAGAEQSRLWVI